jgi:hypothetical protein
MPTLGTTSRTGTAPAGAISAASDRALRAEVRKDLGKASASFDGASILASFTRLERQSCPPPHPH